MTFKRGDGVVLVRSEHTYVIGQPSQEKQRVTVALVTSVTRDGQIKAFHNLSWGTDGAPMQMSTGSGSLERNATKYRLPASEVNMPGVAMYMGNRPWSHDATHTGMPFDSLDEARRELKQFQRGGENCAA